MASALKRELIEELGLDADIGPLGLVTESLAPDAARHVIQVVFHAVRRGEPRVTGIDDRIRAFRWLGAGEASTATFRPPIGPWIQELLRGEAAQAQYRHLEWA
jgi:8-oxo-dGTP pyrophosphatase MutT (NUDIX family)